MALFSGGDGGDFDADGDIGTDASFTLFSLLSIMAFIMGTGWMGLAAPNRLGPRSSRLGRLVGRLWHDDDAASLGPDVYDPQAQPRRSVRRADGSGQDRTGLPDPPATGRGRGQIEVSVSGRKKVLPAVSNGAQIEAFTAVTVVDVRDDDTLVVEPSS